MTGLRSERQPLGEVHSVRQKKVVLGMLIVYRRPAGKLWPVVRAHSISLIDVTLSTHSHFLCIPFLSPLVDQLIVLLQL